MLCRQDVSDTAFRQDVSDTAFCKPNSAHVSLCGVCPVPDMVRMFIYTCIYTCACISKPHTSAGVAKTSGAPSCVQPPPSPGRRVPDAAAGTFRGQDHIVHTSLPLRHISASCLLIIACVDLIQFSCLLAAKLT